MLCHCSRVKRIYQDPRAALLEASATEPVIWHPEETSVSPARTVAILDAERASIALAIVSTNSQNSMCGKIFTIILGIRNCSCVCPRLVGVLRCFVEVIVQSDAKEDRISSLDKSLPAVDVVIRLGSCIS